ncbi:MAG TPA: RdgB/HAM1 family non-canonical purine NTP pyrophosphatase [Vicinamibacterales bacterium]|nr:RdgB/HAM1 family non-canonical purine NTP pyrophosphatase [Vicinamibacterales bacterium]
MADRILIATTNPNKIREIRPLLADLPIELVTLADIDPIPEPEETAHTFWENARIKALAYAKASGLTSIAEDSGLEIDAMNGEPGVLSARFMGAATPYPDRFKEIFRRVNGRDRSARFVTALVMARGNEILFETETAIEGEIARTASGAHGFGYDPIFWYSPLQMTTAQLPDAEKAIVSHRARAFRNLRRFFATRTNSSAI